MKLFQHTAQAVFLCLLIFIGFFGFSANQSGFAVQPTEASNQYMVVLKDPPVFEVQYQLSGRQPANSAAFQAAKSQAQSYALTLSAKQDDMAARIKTAANAEVIRRNTRLVNALTVECDPQSIHTVSSMPGVKSVARVQHYKPMLTESHSLMNLPQAWEQSFNGGATAGEGVLIAVVDTGIDITVPAFDDEGFTMPEGFPKGVSEHTNNKVIVARTFPPAGGNQGDTTPFDREGHGTDVASIAAANLNVDSPLGPLSGVAPGAWLGNYKVFTQVGTASDGQIITAVEQAVEDGADVINLSLGVENMVDPQHFPTVQALRQAMRLGVVVVTAAGNNGAEYTIGMPPQIDEVIAVGSVTNSHNLGDNTNSNLQVSLIDENGEAQTPPVSATFGAQGGPFTEPIIGTFPLVDLDTIDGGGFGGAEDGLLCEPVEVSEPLDAWLLVQRGICEFTDKVNRAREMGARGVLIYDSPERAGGGPLVTNTTIPSMMIGHDQGLQIKSALQDNPALRLKVDFTPINDSSEPPNRLSGFSGQGPGPHYSIKPDVVAVGEGSYGATQNDVEGSGKFEVSGFDWYTGTSMSCPRVSGLAALMKQQHPDWPVPWIKSAILHSGSRPILLKGNSSNQADILRRGTGRVDAQVMLDVNTLVLPAQLGFGSRIISGPEQETKMLAVINTSEQSHEYELRVASDSNIPFSFSSEEFTLEAGGRTEIDVTMMIPGSIVNGDHENDLVLTNLTTGKTLRIPTWVRIMNVLEPTGQILLIDDDDGETFEDFYAQRLDELDRGYTPWDVESISRYPTLNYMNRFETVLWFMGETSLNAIFEPGNTNFIQTFNRRQLFEDDLMKFMMNGGELFLTGQDYLDQRETVAFTHDLMEISLLIRDISPPSVFAGEDNPISGGLGELEFDVPTGFDNIPDRLRVLNNQTTESIFFSDVRRRVTTGVMIDACAYRMVFLAFGLELLDPEPARQILENSLNWFDEKEATPPELASITPNEINFAEQTGPIEVTIEGQGFGLDDGYSASLGGFPLFNVKRESCNTLTGELRAGIHPASYSLSVLTGDGHHLRLKDAVTITGTPDSQIPHWAGY